MAGTWRPAIAKGATARSKVEGFAILTFVFRNEDGSWTAGCRELGTATDGPSLEKVREELVDLVTLHLNALEQAGERERFFEKHRIKFYKAGAEPSVRQLRLPVDDDAFVQSHRIPLDKAA